MFDDVRRSFLSNPEKRYLNSDRQTPQSLRGYELVINFQSRGFDHFFDVAGERRFEPIIIKYGRPHSPGKPVYLIDYLTNRLLRFGAERAWKVGVFAFRRTVFAAGLHL